MYPINEQIGQVWFAEFVEMLFEAGWRPTADAQHENIATLYNQLVILKAIEKKETK